jgi:uncharacterized protein YbjQ (UPF0145 family)
MNSTKRVGVTTTNSIEGWEIDHYFQPVTSHLVVGTNVFSDFLASFTDFFGGNSKTYQKRISDLYTEAVEQLRASADRVGANYIIGLSIDMDEISGKGKSMFMITSFVTPVLANIITKGDVKIKESDDSEIVYAETMNTIRKKRKILEGIKSNNISLEKENWQFVIENKLTEAFPFLITKWKEAIQYQTDTTAIQEKISQLLSQIEPKAAAKMVYDHMVKEESPTVIKGLTQIIMDQRLVDFDLIEEALKSDDFDRQKRILFAVVYDKEYYTKRDIERLRELKRIIQSIFNERGERTSKKQMFSSKEKEIWKCECGKTAEIGEQCSNCGKDIYGFKNNEVKPSDALSYLDEKIITIDEIITGESATVIDQ